jgi:hypothetical protein
VKPNCRWKRWWQFNRPAARFYEIASGCKIVLASSRVTKFLDFQFVPADWIYADKVVLIPRNTFSMFDVLSSSVHQCWAEETGTNLGGTFNYQPTECIQTMPLCRLEEHEAEIGRTFYEYRRSLMQEGCIGLTDLYNRFHDLDESSADFQRLREFQVEMDHAVAAAYGWADLDLGHAFHQTKQGLRYTISEPARREVLARLLKLNHERYAEEVRQGLHEKKKAGKGRAKKKVNAEDASGLFS